MPSDLPPRHAVSYFLGEIVRGDTWVEREMKMLWRALEAARCGAPVERLPKDFAATLKRVRSMIEKPQVGGPFRTLTKQVLEVADAQHKIRRHLVHEILMEPRHWGDRVIAADQAFTIEELDACAESLKTVTWRLRGLFTIAPYWLPPTPFMIVDGYETEGSLRSWARVAMGEIADDKSQVRGTEGPCLEPAGGYDNPTVPPLGHKDPTAIGRLCPLSRAETQEAPTTLA